jgi:hypothetical protein
VADGQRRERGSVRRVTPTLRRDCLEGNDWTALRSVMAVARATTKDGATQLGGGIGGEPRTGRTDACLKADRRPQAVLARRWLKAAPRRDECGWA